ncbi:hypothetical protein J4558_17550 [Leptolyngbya sp. 15MV]|nr:hypothetical protein J4558_17550 [Leptolyngbya sp. 15MV]
MLLSACDSAVQPLASEGAKELVCAIGPRSEFRADCRAERVAVAGEEQIVVRHPDGSFRRFTMLPDGAGIEAADGADAAVQKLSEGMLEVTVAGDRYRFPARPVAGDAAPE